LAKWHCHQTGQVLAGHTNAVYAVTFSPDGKTLATASWDTTVRLWDVVTHHQLGKPLTGHTDGVITLKFAPGGTTLASAGADKTIRVWKVTTPSDVILAACTAVGRSMTRDEWHTYIPDMEFQLTCQTRPHTQAVGIQTAACGPPAGIGQTPVPPPPGP
jgi:WD40 repeat protein